MSKANCWKWFRLYILATKGCKCVQCGKTTEEAIIQAGHVITKSYGNIYYFNRFDVFPQCSYHNSLHNRDNIPYFAWYRNTFGDKRLDRLYELRHKKIKWVGYEARTKRYKKIVEQLKGKNWKP